MLVGDHCFVVVSSVKGRVGAGRLTLVSMDVMNSTVSSETPHCPREQYTKCAGHNCEDADNQVDFCVSRESWRRGCESWLVMLWLVYLEMIRPWLVHFNNRYFSDLKNFSTKFILWQFQNNLRRGRVDFKSFHLQMYSHLPFDKAEAVHHTS